MNLIFRLLLTLLRALFARRRDPLETFVTTWRVLPTDIDAFGHMTNSRYHSIMDLARIDLLTRSGYTGIALRNLWAVPVGATNATFRSALRPFEKYQVQTKVVFWDERWFYFQHRFYRASGSGQPICVATIKTLFRGRKGIVPTSEVVRVFGYDKPPPVLSEELRAELQLPSAIAPAALPASSSSSTVTSEPPRQLAARGEREPLAIVGIGCRLPGGIRGPKDLWSFLMRGGDAICDIPESRWTPKVYHDPSGKSDGRAYVHRAGILQEDIFSFDATFFGISPREAETMDPQQRFLLETSWEAFEDAGICPPSLAGSRTSVFVGGFMIDNQVLHVGPSNREIIGTHSAFAGTQTMLSSRLSYFYDLRGPCMTIDTACSSSLVAAHHAFESLWRGESDMALVGGTNVLLIPEPHITMAKGHFLSPKGRCHAFSADADGYVRSEGTIVAVVRPLSAAIRDGQRVYAVVLGSACNQDGKTPSISVPSGEAQMAVMREAYAAAGISPHDVALVEAHGTGTPVGDPIEARAIGTVVGTGRGADERCVVASIKTNLGHLEAAAGIAGLVKAALCVQHGMVPPHLHAKKVNPNIDLDGLGLALPQEATSLTPRKGRLIAGINSFGYGGTNAHVVVANLPAPAAAEPAAAANPDPWSEKSPILLPLSARSKDSLDVLARAWGSQLQEQPTHARALARTAAVHRAHHRYRGVVVAGDAAAAATAAQNAAFSVQGEFDSRPDLVFVYTGMGPQWWAMGRQLYQTSAVYRASIDRCDELFQGIGGWSLLEELMRSEADSKVTRTEIAQPTNAALQIALTDLWASWGVRPAAVIGHSIGEVGAAYGGGTLNAEQALVVAYHRSRLQQKLAGKGGMLAVGLSPAEAEDCARRSGGKIAVAAVNSATSVTLAGDKGTLAQVARDLESRGVFQRFLQVEVPYHSPLMDGIEDELRASLRTLVSGPTRTPVYSTVTGALLAAPWHDGDYWWKNVRQSVLFSKAMGAALDDGYRVFVEIGPHPVLSPSIRDALKERKLTGKMVASLQKNEGDAQVISNAAATLYTLGVDLDWAAYFGQGAAVDAPKYPWNRKRFWRETEHSRLRRSGAFTEHPLLSSYAPGPMATWTAELNFGRTPYFLDHVVAGAPLFPAAGFIELALSAHAHAAGGAATSLEDIDLVSAVALSPEQATKIIVQAAGDAPAFRISYQTGEETPTLCVRGKWYSSVDQQETLDLATLEQRLPRELSAEALYQNLLQIGLAYGPAFQAVKKLRMSDREVMAWLEVPAEQAQGYALCPMLLDAALHSALAVAGDRYRGAELLPTGIEELGFFRNPGPRAICLAVLELNDQQPRCQLTMLSPDGEVCVRLSGLTFRILRKQVDEAARFAGLLYQRTYVPQPVTSVPPPPSGWPRGSVDQISFARGPAGDCLQLGGAAPVGAEWRHLRDEAVLLRELSSRTLPAVVVDLRFAVEEAVPDFEAASRRARELLATLKAIPQGSVRRYYLVTIRAEARPLEGERTQLGGALACGLARTAMTERPDLGLTLIDVEGASRLVAESFGSELLGLGADQEWVIRDGAWHAGRVSRLVAEEQVTPTVAFDRQRGSCELVLGEPGRFSAIELVECDRPVAGQDEVIVAVEAVPLGFKDVMKALGILSSRAVANTYFGDSMGMECAGRVVAVGPGVTGYAVGDRVYAAAPGTLRSHVRVRTSHVWKLPDSLSYVDGANVIVFATVYHGLVNVAKLKKGETVLIHGATGGVGLAAIQVAQWCGATIIATAGTEEKRQHLRELGLPYVSHSRDTRFYDDVMRWTEGRGVDVVLNFTPGEVMLRSVSCLAPFGRFIEIGKVAFDQDTPLPLRAFNENLLFAAIDFDRMTRFRIDEVRTIALEVFARLEAGDFKPMPAAVFPASQVGEAFRTMARGKHIGKIVIDMSDPELHVRPRPQPAVKPDATYLVTGGLGGFGLEIARTLVARGARHLALCSRSGANAPEAKAQLTAWREQGLDIRAIAVDVADRAALERALAEVGAAMPPLRGVVHAAAVLDDRPLAELDDQALRTAFEAKARGAWNLHQLTREQPLDVFVTFSSISAVIGNANQANYVAANNFLDQLAAYRRQLGLPAVSIQWGALGETGMVARNAALGRFLGQQGVTALSNEIALDAFVRVLVRWRELPASFVVADVDFAKLASRMPDGSGKARLAEWSQDSKAPGARMNARRQSAESDPQAARADLEAELVRIAAKVTKIPAAELNLTQPMREIGMDSLMALEISSEIENEIGVRLPTMALVKGPSLQELAEKIFTDLRSSGGDSDQPMN